MSGDHRGLLEPRNVADPYPLFAELRRDAPVWQVPETDTWLVSSWRLVTEALGRTDDFSSNLTALLIRGESANPVVFDLTSAGTALDVLATADDPSHAVHRRLVLPHLVAKRVSELRAGLADLAGVLWAEGLDGDYFEWAEAMADRLPLTVVARLIGLPDDDVPTLLQWAYEGTELLAGVVAAARMEYLSAAAADMAAYLADQYDGACLEPGDDLLGDLARAGQRGEITKYEAVAMLVQLVGAGGESTAGLIGNGARLLAARPDLQQQLRNDPSLLSSFLDEALRLESPFRGHYRTVSRDTTLGDVQLPAGGHLMLLWGAANRDPAAFDQPDDIRLGRPDSRAHLAFGRGMHYCVGAALARLEASVALGVLLHSTRSFALDPDTAPEWVPSIFVRRQARLRLRIQPA